MYSAALRYLYCADTHGKGALHFAYAYALITVQREDVPPSVWSDVFKVHQKLYLPNYVTPVDSSRVLVGALDQMSDDKIAELVSLIYSTHKRLETMYESENSIGVSCGQSVADSATGTRN